ncbi:acetylcholine receptor subunit alpha-like 2 [Palaemon carinicauda]|uniref:acetylcholine receptor subunit alpha-like 2 n=1 Tax=Palaemon carinicauda TaxID=392227 RepID=UPI0035B5B0BC
MGLWLRILITGMVMISQTGAYRGHEEQLRNDLFRTYNQLILPAESTLVVISVRIMHFEMDERRHSLMVDTWFSIEWTDPRLKWNPEEFGGINKIHVPYEMLWIPDIAIYNSANGGEDMAFGTTQALLYYNGSIVFVPSVKLDFSCVMDLTLWPHDSHNCTCVIGSWVHDGIAIDLHLKADKPESNLPVRVTNGGRNLTRNSWDLVDSNITREVQNYLCCPEPYVMIHLSMLLTRDAPAYEWIIKGPAIGLSLLTMVLFLLPPAAGEKVLFGILCLILDMLFIAYASYTISLAPTHLPLIVELICKQATLVITSIVVGVVSLRMARDPHSLGLPSFIKTPVLRLSSLLCIESYKNLASRVHHYQYSPNVLKTDEYDMKENGNGHVYTADDVSSTFPSFDWLLLSAFMDRICLIIFAIIFVVNLYKFSAIL